MVSRILCSVYVLFCSFVPLSYAVHDADELPVDITFGVVDLKFDGTHVKICEFGEGLFSGFEGYHALHGPHELFQKISQRLHSLHDTCVVYANPLESKRLAHSLLHVFNAQENIHIKDQRDFYKTFKYQNNTHNNALQNIKDKPGIFIYRQIDNKLKHYIEKNHGFIILSKYSRDIFPKKCLVQRYLFAQDQDLERFRPQSLIYPTNYSSDLAENIKQQLPCEYLVIKPEFGHKGKGIIFTSQDSLDGELQKICINNALHEQPNNLASPYKYWHKRPQKNFIVEEFARSKTIIVENKPYDATMRVIFLASCQHQEITIDFVDAYWKLPQKALDEKGTFDECHRSCINAHRAYDSALVSPEDFQQVVKQLQYLLPKTYRNMLIACANKNIFI